jgi:acetolactate synthase I/II/III large subunit
MISREQIASVVKLLQEARRPIFVWGNGMRQCHVQALALARSLGIPVACTWGAIDLIHHDDPLMCGGFGTHGTRAANFAVQNSDLCISIGSRLDTKSTGMPSHFLRVGKLVMVDIDQAEISKFTKLGRTIDIGICADAGEFIEALNTGYPIPPAHAWEEWIDQIHEWRKRYDTPTVTWPGINPYELVKEIGKYTDKDADKDTIICSDTGTALGYLMQAFPFKGECFLHAFNMTPMGYGLPAAVGASFATNKRVILLTGDGSFMMSLAELSTVARWNLNIKIILLNNGQHSMCVQTENQWFGGRNASTTVASGLGFPESFKAVAESFGIRAYSSLPPKKYGYDVVSGYETVVGQAISDDGPTFVEVFIHPDARLLPQCRFGYPLEDAEPALSREELEQQMIIPLLETA